MKERIEHLRVIHFSLILLSFTMLYFIYIGYTDSPELYNQLRTFREYVQNIDLEQPDLMKVNGDAVRWEFSQTPLGWRLAKEDIPRDLYRVMRGRIKLEEMNVEQIIRMLNSRFDLQVELVDEPVDPNQLKLELERLDREAGNDQGKAATWAAKVKWKRDEALVVITKTAYITKISSSTENSVESRPIRFKKKVCLIRIPDNWASPYGRVLEYQKLVGRKTLEVAIADTRGLFSSNISAKEPEFLGMKFDGDAIGLVGPMAQFFILIYLLVFAADTCRALDQSGVKLDDPVPWICLTNTPLTHVINVISLIILPVVTVFFAIYRFVVPGFFWALLATFLCGVVGSIVFLLVLCIHDYQYSEGGSGSQNLQKMHLLLRCHKGLKKTLRRRNSKKV